MKIFIDLFIRFTCSFAVIMQFFPVILKYLPENPQGMSRRFK